MVPGGYNFFFIVFWAVVGMVAIGTNLIPIILSAGIGIYILENIKKKKE